MKMKRILSLLLSVCLLILLMPVNSIAANGYSTVSGVISLPGNDVAPSGGVKVKLTIGTDNNTHDNKNDDKSVTTELTITKGQKSIAYSIQVPKSQNTKAKYYVYYTAENGYAPFGWYNKDKTTAVKEKRTLIDLNTGDVSGINIELLPGRPISGKIIFGNSSVKPMNDLKFTVTAVQEGTKANSADDDIIISKEVVLKAHTGIAAYELIVPVNDPGKGYKVYYTFENQGYKETGYYHKDGTSRDAGRVTLIDVANTVKGIDLNTLPFTNITGKISLPGKDKAKTNGLEIKITAFNSGSDSSASDDFSFSKAVTISKDSSSAFYALTVPVVSTDYIISYEIVTKNTEYENKGFYNKAKTEKDKKNATPIRVGNTNIAGIDLEILRKTDPKPAPPSKPNPEIPEKYDVNGDGYVNILDLLDLAKVLAEKYEKEGFKINPEEYRNRIPDKKELDAIRKALKPFFSKQPGPKLHNIPGKGSDFDSESWFDKFLKEWKAKDSGSHNSKKLTAPHKISLKKIKE